MATQYNNSLNPQQKAVLATFIRQESKESSDDYITGYVAGFTCRAHTHYGYPDDKAQTIEYKQAWSKGCHDSQALEEAEEQE